ncbi:MAG: hypothetical protein K6G75_08745 [Lachnospiraceae bacterium]|nr:hypothetical protein [Lachnospiraceae bacterium]
MSLLTALIIGLTGAILMLCGDMTLYFSKDDYKHDGTLNPIIDIMKKAGTKRLYIGGMIGPVTAFLYCVGYFHLVLFAKDKFVVIGWILFLVNCLGIICGGAYHSHCANLGLIGRHEDEETLKEVTSFLDFQKKVAFGIQAFGFIGMALMIVMGWSALPRWMIVFTPLVLILLLPLVRKLPKGIHMVVCGGWTNMISVIYYAAAILCVVLNK